MHGPRMQRCSKALVGAVLEGEVLGNYGIIGMFSLPASPGFTAYLGKCLRLAKKLSGV